jgi:hypothetical protein
MPKPLVADAKIAALNKRIARTCALDDRMMTAAERVMARVDEIRSLSDPDLLALFETIDDVMQHLATKRP